MYCCSATKRYLKRTKFDRKIKLIFLTLFNSKNKHVHALPNCFNNNDYIPKPKQLDLS